MSKEDEKYPFERLGDELIKNKLKELKKMTEQNMANNLALENTINLLMPYFKIELPGQLTTLMITPMRVSYDSSKINVENIVNLPEPTKYVAMSNFLFGKMFGKTELILQILDRVKKE